jgi:serine protease Do
MPGCLIVVDRDRSHDDECESAPRHALGVNLERVDAATASQLGLDRDRVALITRVSSGSAADRAGLKKFDIVTRVDGADSASSTRVREAVRSGTPGQPLRLTVLREGKPVEVTATIP